jgi:hypothetical protein
VPSSCSDWIGQSRYLHLIRTLSEPLFKKDKQIKWDVRSERSWTDLGGIASKLDVSSPPPNRTDYHLGLRLSGQVIREHSASEI